MVTKTHAILALFFCSTTSIVIFTKSLQLIGLLHGPSDEKNALDQRQSVQTKLLALAEKNEDLWPRYNTEKMEDLDFEPYQSIAYQDHRALILRDAGIIAALLALILVLVPNFTSICYSASQRLCFFLLALPLYIMPGLVGQVVFQKTIPIEIILLNAWGMTKGLSYIGYYSIQSLIGLGADGPSTIFTLHELKVVMSAGFLVFLVLGLMPPGK